MAEEESDVFITLPPGFAPPAPVDSDSGTVRRDRSQRARADDEVVFFPASLGPAAVAPDGAPGPTADALPAAAPNITSVDSESTGPESTTAEVPHPEDDFGQTRVSVSRHARPTWRLVFPDGAPAVPVDGSLFLGRNPTVAAGFPGARAIPILEPGKSISKTHALLELVDDRLYVHDLDSTNGVWVVPVGGEAIEVVPGTRREVLPGFDIELGDTTIKIEHS